MIEYFFFPPPSPAISSSLVQKFQVLCCHHAVQFGADLTGCALLLHFSSSHCIALKSGIMFLVCMLSIPNPESVFCLSIKSACLQFDTHISISALTFARFSGKGIYVGSEHTAAEPAIYTWETFYFELLIQIQFSGIRKSLPVKLHHFLT